jgi:cell division protein FtsL
MTNARELVQERQMADTQNNTDERLPMQQASLDHVERQIINCFAFVALLLFSGQHQTVANVLHGDLSFPLATSFHVPCSIYL